MIDPREFRSTLGRFATGVTVVTMEDRGVPHGITVNAFLSASLVPPLVAVCVDQRANAHATLQEVDRFGVSILAESQRVLSDYFAGRIERVDADPFVRSGEVPLVAGALGHLVCRVAQRLPVGDHTFFVGEVEDLAYADGRPLLYYRGSYGRLG